MIELIFIILQSSIYTIYYKQQIILLAGVVPLFKLYMVYKEI